MQKSVISTFKITLAGWVLMFAVANTDALAGNAESDISERARLKNVTEELAFLQQYVAETKDADKPNRRSRFNYEKLQQEMERMKAGILDYLNTNSSKPKQPNAPGRSIDTEPITGKYQT